MDVNSGSSSDTPVNNNLEFGTDILFNLDVGIDDKKGFVVSGLVSDMVDV